MDVAWGGAGRAVGGAGRAWNRIEFASVARILAVGGSWMSSWLQASRCEQLPGQVEKSGRDSGLNFRVRILGGGGEKQKDWWMGDQSLILEPCGLAT